MLYIALGICDSPAGSCHLTIICKQGWVSYRDHTCERMPKPATVPYTNAKEGAFLSHTSHTSVASRIQHFIAISCFKEYSPHVTPCPAGVLLSGGLDSSLVAAIAARKVGKGGTVWGKLHSFCVGLPGSPDLKAARQVAEFLETKHYEFTFTVQVGVECEQ